MKTCIYVAYIIITGKLDFFGQEDQNFSGEVK